jgi:heme-degrading monooxygenase HmoA
MKFWKNGKAEKPPYYAVIFSSEKSETLDGFEEMDEKILKLAIQQEGFLGYESSGNGKENIFISYWKNLKAIDAWRHNMQHIEAKELGIKHWYKRYLSQICKVEHSHEMIK